MIKKYLFLDPSRPLAFGQVGFGGGFTSFSWETKRDLAGKLPEILDEMLTAAALKIRDVDVLAICTGPGSLTGLRVGLSFFRTLSQVAKKPLLGIDLFSWAAHTLQREGVKGTYKLFTTAFMNHAFADDVKVPIPSDWSAAPELLELKPQRKIPVRSFGIRCQDLGNKPLELTPEALHELIMIKAPGEFSFDEILRVKPMYIVPSQPEIKLAQKAAAGK